MKNKNVSKALNKSSITAILNNTELTSENIAELEKYKSEDGSYIIPVEWSVRSTVKIKNADSLADAISLVAKNIDIIPCDVDSEYINDSYKIAISTIEDAENSQAYEHIGSIYFDENKRLFTKYCEIKPKND